MPNIKAIIEYDGTDFCGFQKQPKVRTVQGEIERALSIIFPGHSIKTIGAGRTDAGVHATGQVVNFTIPESFAAEKVRPALNGTLPRDITVREAGEVPSSFHARYSAKSRTYIYIVLNRVPPSALLRRCAWHVSRPLDIEAMRAAGRLLTGKHDFSSFGMPDRPGGATIRQVFDLDVEPQKDSIVFTIRANAFLRGMARAMVGTLVEIGQGRRSPDEAAEMLAARDRQAVRVNAPPQGLYLTKVEY